MNYFFFFFTYLIWYLQDLEGSYASSSWMITVSSLLEETILLISSFSSLFFPFSTLKLVQWTKSVTNFECFWKSFSFAPFFMFTVKILPSESPTKSFLFLLSRTQDVSSETEGFRKTWIRVPFRASHIFIQSFLLKIYLNLFIFEVFLIYIYIFDF